MNDRAGLPAAREAAEMAIVEQFVGALSGVAKGVAAADLVAGLVRYAAATGVPVPAWLTERVVVEAQERLRQVAGAWRATPHGGALELAWPPDGPPRVGS